MRRIELQKDVETSVRYMSTCTASRPIAPSPSAGSPQGRRCRPSPHRGRGAAYKITRPADFIDLGDGRVRLMFRVGAGSTGTVKYGASASSLDRMVSWASSDDINKNGLVLSDFTAGAQVFYQITTEKLGYRDESTVQSLTPPSPWIRSGADYASWGQGDPVSADRPHLRRRRTNATQRHRSDDGERHRSRGQRRHRRSITWRALPYLKDQASMPSG